jgi:hypothetical protein
MTPTTSPTPPTSTPHVHRRSARENRRRLWLRLRFHLFLAVLPLVVVSLAQVDPPDAGMWSRDSKGRRGLLSEGGTGHRRVSRDASAPGVPPLA